MSHEPDEKSSENALDALNLKPVSGAPGELLGEAASMETATPHAVVSAAASDV